MQVLARLQVPHDPFEQAAAGVGEQGCGKGLARRVARERQPVPGAAEGDDLGCPREEAQARDFRRGGLALVGEVRARRRGDAGAWEGGGGGGEGNVFLLLL